MVVFVAMLVYFLVQTTRVLVSENQTGPCISPSEIFTFPQSDEDAYLSPYVIDIASVSPHPKTQYYATAHFTACKLSSSGASSPFTGNSSGLQDTYPTQITAVVYGNPQGALNSYGQLTNDLATSFVGSKPNYHPCFYLICEIATNDTNPDTSYQMPTVGNSDTYPDIVVIASMAVRALHWELLPSTSTL